MALECSRRIQLLNTMLRTFSGQQEAAADVSSERISCQARTNGHDLCRTWVGQCARALGQETSVVGERDFGLGLEQVVMW